MGPTFVTGQQAANSAAGTSTNVTINGVTAGNLLIAVAATDDATPAATNGVAGGATWTRIATKVGGAFGGGGFYGSLGIFVGLNATGGNTTVTLTNSTAFVALSVAEYSPNGQAVADGTSSAGSATSTTVNPGALTTTTADDVLIAGATDAIDTVTWTAGAGWGLRANVGSSANTNVVLQDKTVSAIQTGVSTAFGNSTPNGWTAIAAGIKTAGVSNTANIGKSPNNQSEISYKPVSSGWL